MTKTKPNKKSVYVDEDIHRQVKIAAAIKGMDIASAVEEAMSVWLANHADPRSFISSNTKQMFPANQ